MIPPTLLTKILFIYDLFLAVPGLRCCTGFSAVVVSGSYSVVAVYRLRWLWSTALGSGVSVVLVPKLYGTGSVAVGHRLHCSAVYGIFPDQGWNPCFLHWQADSLPLSHQGRPHSTPFIHCWITNFILKVVSVLNPFLPFFL